MSSSSSDSKTTLASFPLDRHPYRVANGSSVDLGKRPTRDDQLFSGGKSDGKKLMQSLADQVGDLQSMLYAEGKKKFLFVIQAMDTGGKDGTIKDVFESVDPQGLRCEPFKKPTSKELAHDYLWRVHKKVPGKGELVIFNRSHYEDILAVRVRDIAPESVWSKRYDHINNFEKMLSDEGCAIVKIFLHISPDEQKERLQARLDNSDKHWKFNPGDLDDRALWPKFMNAYQDVLSRTSTDYAPWYVIPADRKWYRNLGVASIVIDTFRSLGMSFPKPDFDPNAITIE
jgi:PPK2 family polyphosphate:nucleotide phosphotransferase